jgi:drug/metabolite transporter (DMT)-like permease
MAEEVQISGSNERGKIRNPLGVIGLAIITFGIYGIFWYYFINKELAELGKAKGTNELGDSPGTSVLAVTLGVFAIVPPFISYYNYGKRLQAAERLTGTEPGMEPGLLLVLWIFIAPVALYIAQANQNKVLQTQAGGAGAIPAAQPQTQQPAPATQEQPAASTQEQPPPPGA